MLSSLLFNNLITTLGGKSIDEILKINNLSDRNDLYYSIERYPEREIPNPVYILVALVLRTNIEFHDFPSSIGSKIETFKSRYSDFEFIRNDSLAFHEDTIKILRVGKKYGVLYTKEEYYKYDDNVVHIY